MSGVPEGPEGLGELLGGVSSQASGVQGPGTSQPSDLILEAQSLP